MNKDQKFYNPYPFTIRILNDLGMPYVMTPQDYSKVLNGRYELSKLTLLKLEDQREFYKGIEMNLNTCKKDELVPIAWAVCLDDVDQSMTKSEIIDAIEEKIGEQDFGLGHDDEDELENPLDPNPDEDEDLDLGDTTKEEMTIDESEAGNLDDVLGDEETD